MTSPAPWDRTLDRSIPPEFFVLMKIEDSKRQDSTCHSFFCALAHQAIVRFDPLTRANVLIYLSTLFCFLCAAFSFGRMSFQICSWCIRTLYAASCWGLLREISTAASRPPGFAYLVAKRCFAVSVSFYAANWICPKAAFVLAASTFCSGLFFCTVLLPLPDWQMYGNVHTSVSIDGSESGFFLLCIHPRGQTCPLNACCLCPPFRSFAGCCWLISQQLIQHTTCQNYWHWSSKNDCKRQNYCICQRFFLSTPVNAKRIAAGEEESMEGSPQRHRGGRALLAQTRDRWSRWLYRLFLSCTRSRLAMFDCRVCWLRTK